MPRRSATRQRGTVYLLVLVVTAMLVGIGVAAAIVGRIDLKAEALEADQAQARQLGRGGVEVVRKRLENNSDWRTDHTHDAWSADIVVGRSVCAYKLVDEGDGSLSDDPADPVRVYVRATVGQAVRIYSAVLYMGVPTTAQAKIVRSGDDAGQAYLLGLVATNADYILIGQDGLLAGGMAAVRFDNLPLAQGAEVLSAQIQFTADGSQNDATAISIQAEAADDAAGFLVVPYSISGRPSTSAIQVWAPGAWTDYASGPEQLTPDLSAVMQEVIDRPGWRAGNAIVFALDGTKARYFYSYDHDPEHAAVLHYTYLNPGMTVDYTTLRRELAP